MVLPPPLIAASNILQVRTELKDAMHEMASKAQEEAELYSSDYQALRQIRESNGVLYMQLKEAHEKIYDEHLYAQEARAEQDQLLTQLRDAHQQLYMEHKVRGSHVV